MFDFISDAVGSFFGGDSGGETSSAPAPGGSHSDRPGWLGPGSALGELVLAGAEASHMIGPTLGAFTGPLGLVLGGYEVADGVKNLDKPMGQQKGHAIHEIIQGGASVVGGLATTGAGLLAASGGAAAGGAAGAALSTVGCLAASLAGGMAVGHLGDEASQSINLFGNDRYGRPQGASDFSANVGVDNGKAVRNATGSETLGDIAGIGSVLGTLPLAAAGSMASLTLAPINALFGGLFD